MTHAENKVEWCLTKAEKEGRKHKGLRVVKPDVTQSACHVAKADHSISLIPLMIERKAGDWAVSMAFYAQYHSLLAVLWKFGYESKNQTCTIAAVELLIEQGKIDLTKEDIERIWRTKEENEHDRTDLVTLRERFQYGTETTTEETFLLGLLQETKEFVEKCKTLLEV